MILECFFNAFVIAFHAWIWQPPAPSCQRRTLVSSHYLQCLTPVSLFSGKRVERIFTCASHTFSWFFAHVFAHPFLHQFWITFSSFVIPKCAPKRSKLAPNHTKVHSEMPCGYIWSSRRAPEGHFEALWVANPGCFNLKTPYFGEIWHGFDAIWWKCWMFWEYFTRHSYKYLFVKSGSEGALESHNYNLSPNHPTSRDRAGGMRGAFE